MIPRGARYHFNAATLPIYAYASDAIDGAAMDAPSREIPDIWVRTRRRGLFGLAVVAAAAVAAWAGRGTSRVVRPFEFEEDDEHVFGLANASASRLGNATVSGLRDDDTDVDGLCLDYCPNTTSANDAACRLCDLQKVVRFHNE